MGLISAVPSLGWPELLLILAALLLLFGARKLPEIARSLGKSTKEFKSGMREGAIEAAEQEKAQEEQAKAPETPPTETKPQT